MAIKFPAYTLPQALLKRATIQHLVFTNGTFDLLHPGHVTYLQQARALGDALFIGLNSNTSVTALKGPRRPLLDEADRALMLSALACVDAVIIFGEPTAHNLIAALRPEIYVKGGDYSLSPDQPGTVLPEAPLVQGYGGQVKLLPLKEGHSTSTLIERIVNRYGDAQSE
jgi:rfaE bifunctional protein nucleotidyltransferase chain/domain